MYMYVPQNKKVSSTNNMQKGGTGVHYMPYNALSGFSPLSLQFLHVYIHVSGARINLKKSKNNEDTAAVVLNMLFHCNKKVDK